MTTGSDQSAEALESIRVRFLDVQVTPANAERIVHWIQTGTGKRRLMNHNLHSVWLTHTHADFNKSYRRADAILIDGFPLGLLIKAGLSEGPSRASVRVGSCDWIMELERQKPKSIRRIAIVGASEASNKAMVERLSQTMPGVEAIGWDGYVGLNGLIINEFDELSEFQPDLVLVGLGMPKQEIVLDTYYDILPDAVYATVGGAIDQLSGFQKMPPRALGGIGLEWLYRLIRDPRRLAYRYLVEPICLVVLLMGRRITSGR